MISAAITKVCSSKPRARPSAREQLIQLRLLQLKLTRGAGTRCLAQFIELLGEVDQHLLIVGVHGEWGRGYEFCSGEISRTSPKTARCCAIGSRAKVYEVVTAP